MDSYDLMFEELMSEEACELTQNIFIVVEEADEAVNIIEALLG